MSLLAIIVQAVQSFRLRGGAIRTRKRAEIRLEQLDHRQLLAVNFTGNVPIDFTGMTPAVYLTDPNNHQPTIPGNLTGIVNVSGFAISNVAVNYDQATDTLSVGFLQPPSLLPGNPTAPVIAGDADDNGLNPLNAADPNPLIPNNSTTAPAALARGVTDEPGISGSEYMIATIDLSGGTDTANKTIVAGIPQPNLDKTFSSSRYVVAQADYQGGPTTLVPTQVGPELPGFEGNVYLPFNDPRHPALEFSITHFSQLYLEETGKVLNAQSVIGVGAFGGSGNDGGINEQSFHFQPLPVGTATTPTPVPPVVPPPPPPVIVELFQPTILINPHENRHVNTSHYDNVRVTVLSSASFDATTIDPSTVRFGGAAPIASFSRIQLRDGIPSETFVFKGTDINLPPGFTSATITGKTFSGIVFTGSEVVFNRNDSFYSQSAIRARDLRLSRFGATVAQENGLPALAGGQASQSATAAFTGTTDPNATWVPTQTVRITPRQAAAARLQARMATVAAQAFQSATPITAPAQSTSSGSAALLAHDLALQSMAGSNSTSGAGAA